MKHILSYQLFENESGSKIESLDFLFKNGIIDLSEYGKEIKILLDEGEIQPSDLSDEILPIILINNEDFVEYDDEDAEEFFKNWISDWRGPGGVRIAIAEGGYDETSFDFRFILSNGDRIRANWNGNYGQWHDLYLERHGTNSRIEVQGADDLYSELDDKYDGETAAPFYNEWLNALMMSA
jgi:hypothetical protein